jgi:pyruvate,water dikinase
MRGSLGTHWLITDAERGGPELVGGKAAGLYRLIALGLPVPEFVVLTTDAWRRACPDGVVPDALPADVASELDAAWEHLGGGPESLAVRSSAVGEDDAERSYAGQMETFLNVASRDALSGAVLGCWRSMTSARARAYRSQHGAGEPLAMAVVIQRMVAPDAAGVVFTVNPATGRADEIVVSSVWGLGEGLVSGALDADTFVLDPSGAVVSRQIVDKPTQVIAAPGGGTGTAPVPADRVTAASLDDAVLREVASKAADAAARAGRPLDVEFAVCHRRLFFLQARPVTGLGPRAAHTAGERRVWDNSNIIESYPGITRPLTFSFIRMAYHAAYWQFCEVLGLSEPEIRRRDAMLWNMLGRIRGRVYYNLLNWYRLVALLPGFRWNKGFMEQMMGLREAPDLDEPPPSWRRRWLVELPRLLRVGARAVRLHRSLPRRIRAFHREFDAVHGRFAKIDFDALDPRDALDRFAELEEQVLWRWKAPIINDFAAMIFYGLLKRLTVAWGVDPDGSIHNALISGEGSIESTQVTTGLLAVARLIAADDELAAAVRSMTPRDALECIRDDARAGPPFQRWLDRYGDRCVGELKLESVPMRDDPAFCVALIRSHLRGPVHESRGDRSALRREAESQVDQRLRGRFTRFGLPKRPIYRWVLRHARAAVRNRENQRLARTRAFALVRRIFHAVGAGLARRGAIGAVEDVHYLELDEIRAFVGGADATPGLRERVRARKAEYDRYRSLPAPPDHFETRGAPDGEFAGEDANAEPATAMLSGLGACPGLVEGPAVVLDRPDASLDLNGEILVARQTDPGWVVLFPAISALVVERGSMLSHSAIVAREMGIPAVVGVRGATARIRTGDRLRLDGARGIVEIVEQEDRER